MMLRPLLIFIFATTAILTTQSLRAQSQQWPGSSTAPQYQSAPWNPEPSSSQPERLKIKAIDGDSSDAAKTGSKSRTSPGSTMSIAWTFGCLIFVCGLMMIGAKLFKKKMGISSQALPTEVLQLLGRKQLTPTQQIYLMRLGPKVVMIGAGPEGLRTLSEITDPVEVDLMTGLCLQKEESASPQQFLKLFQKSMTPPSAPESDSQDAYDRLRQNLDDQRQTGTRGSYEV